MAKKIVVCICTLMILVTVIVLARSINSPPEKISYGQCVSKNCTVAKNACFDASKTSLKSCLFQVANSTNKTEKRKNFSLCFSQYKEAKALCKDSFKQCKDSCIQFKCKDDEYFLNSSCKKACMGNDQCKNREFCNHEICLPPPNCKPGQSCVDVCYGFCERNTTRNIHKLCQNFPPASFCEGGKKNIIVTGTDEQGCSIYGCKEK